jgi:uncharacterized protein YjbI with pentapeptide repeats
LTAVAGLFAAGALVFTALNFSLSRRTFELTEQGQVTDRYTKAVEQLGSDKLDVRIGGIYALERVARDSARDHSTVMEVLAAFIREHSREPWPPPDTSRRLARTVLSLAARSSSSADSPPERLIRPDILAAVKVIRRRDAKRDRQPINLAGARLTGAYLIFARLSFANLTGADLRGADLHSADLRGADLTGADLRGAELTVARLNRAQLVGPDALKPPGWEDLEPASPSMPTFLRGANLAGADLRGADLRGADLTGADLRGADLTVAKFRRAPLGPDDLKLELAGLSGMSPASPSVPTFLLGANLAGANLTSADLTDAALSDRTDLTGADLTGAKIRRAGLGLADLTYARWPAAEPAPKGWMVDDTGRLKRAGRLSEVTAHYL